LEGVILNNEPDKLVWKLTNTGEFSVKSLYLAMQCNEVVPYKFMWKVKIPLRIKTFLWLMLKKSILTRDVLLKRGGKCEKNCLFCGCNETIDHLFFKFPLARYIWNVVSCTFGFNFHFDSADHCISTWLKRFGGKKKEILAVVVAAVIWSIWKTRNLACFEKTWPEEPYIVILKICYYINSWNCLQVKEDAKNKFELCARVLKKVPKEVFGSRRRWITWMPRLKM
jgi:hypothetical protein